jgi:hypothetical protein
MPENTDGIKKLSQEELARSRRLVLETIGEDQKLNEKAPVNKKMDSVIRPSIIKNEPKLAGIKENIIPAVGSTRTDENILERAKLVQKEIAKNEPAPKKKPIIETPKKRQIGSDIKPARMTSSDDYAPDFKKIITFTDYLNKNKKNSVIKSANVKDPFQNKISPRNVFKKKQPIENISVQKFNLLKNLSAIIKKSQLNTKNYYSRLAEGLKKNLLKSITLSAILFVSLIIVYSLYVLAVLKFNLDNKFLRNLNVYCPVPALIYNNRVVNYYDYKYIKQTLGDESEKSGNEIKKSILRRLMLLEIASGKGVTDLNAKNNSELEEELSKKVIYDIKINQVAIDRINKIKQMIKTSGQFDQISEKYADEQGVKSLTISDMENLDFYKAIEYLAIGDISPIVAQPEGFYIFRYDATTATQKNFSYIFIKTKNIGNYVDEEVNNSRIISFVD